MSSILIDGPIVALNSASLLNRQLATKLLSLGHSVTITREKGNDVNSYPPEIQELHQFTSGKNPVDVTIRNNWPPDFSRPASGKLVVIQPWEFGSTPRKWVEGFSDRVDEIWVPSNYVRDVYVASGVPAEKVVIVPPGIDPNVFKPDVPAFELNSNKGFKFLFVGGAIPRKGIDILLDAYTSAFSSSDDVCLVIKDFGADTFYKGMSFRDRIKDMTRIPGAPAVEYIDRELSENDLAGLYVACDVLMNPYRGEGFGVPILEALACGTTPIITNGGAALDFCNERNSILVDASVQVLGKKEVFGMETLDYPTIFKVDIEDLKSKMLWASRNKSLLNSMGKQNAEPIRAAWTWMRTGEIADKRIRHLTGPPMNLESKAGVSSEHPVVQTSVETTQPIAKDAGSLNAPVKLSDAKYHYLNGSILHEVSNLLRAQSEADRVNLVRNIMDRFAGLGKFYVHFGGAGDALLLLSTFYDESSDQMIVSVSPSPDSSKSLFDAFPRLKGIYFIPYPEEFVSHILLRKLFVGMPGFLGMGTTPRDPYYFDEWGHVKDLTVQYGVNTNPGWARRLCDETEQSSSIVIHPVGGISPLDHSVRKMITSDEVSKIVGTLNADGITPTIIGTPAEAEYYHLDGLRVDDRRSYSFGEQMRIIASGRLLIGADSWAKTFAALCGKPAIVFHSLRGGSRSGVTEVGDNIFLKPWPTITVVNNVSEFINALHDILARHEIQPNKSQL